MPWYVLGSSGYADSNELCLAWNGCVMMEKSGFYFVCSNLFSLDLPCLGWVSEIGCYICDAWCVLMLLLCSFFDSGHFEILIIWRWWTYALLCWTLKPAQKSTWIMSCWLVLWCCMSVNAMMFEFFCLELFYDDELAWMPWLLLHKP